MKFITSAPGYCRANPNAIQSIKSLVAQHALKLTRSFATSAGEVKEVFATPKDDIGVVEVAKLYSKKAISQCIESLASHPHHDAAEIARNIQSTPSQFIFEDIVEKEQENFGQALVASSKDILVKHGKHGVAPSDTKSPLELILPDNQLITPGGIIIPKGTLSLLNIRTYLPFIFETNGEFVLQPTTKMQQLTPYEEIDKLHQLDTVLSLGEENAKRLSLKIQEAIWNDSQGKRESFYEETTLPAWSPSTHLANSGTWMEFIADPEKAAYADSSPMHYHPGERCLLIVTTNTNAGVKLNFCGINESPDNCPSTEKIHDFEKNSISIVRFAAHAHHEFYGTFVCASFHPKEGANIIAALESGNMTKGFLETATVMSDGVDSPYRNNMTQSSQKNRSRTR